MTNEKQVAEASSELSKYTQAFMALEEAKRKEIEVTDALAKETNLANHLKQQEIDLARKTENRRDARIAELLDYVARAEQRQTDQVANLISKLVTVDDSYGETVQRIIQVLRLLNGSQMDVEKAVYAILVQNETEITKAKITIADRHQTSAVQEELIIRMQNLSRLELQAAGHGALNVPTWLSNQIQAEQDKIAELQIKLGVS